VGLVSETRHENGVTRKVRVSGVVVGRQTPDARMPLKVHNIGNGPEVEDMLTRFPITGHYRYRGE
jgi:uncharacterized protein YijF (DUF1287 family)